METLNTFIFNATAFIIILSVIVFVHEFGHYIVAKLCGVKIEVFSIGFGKELCGWNDKSGTRWKISMLPLGGYVKMYGDIDPASAPDTNKINAMTKEEQKMAFHTKRLPAKSAIVAAGPIANFILAIIILTFFFSYYGKPVTLPKISSVIEGSAAEEAGFNVNDLIIDIDGTKVSSFSDVQRIIGINTGTPVNVKILRDEKEQQITVTPKMVPNKDMFGNEIKAPMLGISADIVSYGRLNIIIASKEAVIETYNIAASTLKAIGQMIAGERSAREISGPIGIAKYSGQSAQHGIQTVLWFITILSINLGLVNLFPIPVLDGGHLLYYFIEAVRGKPMADKIQQIGFKIGIALVATLAIFAIFNDIRNLKMF